MITGVLLLAISITFASRGEPPRQAAKQCNDMTYENRNQVDPPPLVVSALFGRAFVEIGDPAEHVDPATGLCLGLFTEGKHRLIASSISDQEGRFRFPRPAAGRYRLVGLGAGLCTVNVRLQVVASLRRKGPKQQRIVLHMRPPGIDRCSYADFK